MKKYSRGSYVILFFPFFSAVLIEFLMKCHSLPSADQEYTTYCGCSVTLLPFSLQNIAVIKKEIRSTALLYDIDYQNTIKNTYDSFLVVSRAHHSALFDSIEKCQLTTSEKIWHFHSAVQMLREQPEIQGLRKVTYYE